MSKIFTSKNYQNLINKKVGTNTPFSKLFKNLWCQIFKLCSRQRFETRHSTNSDSRTDIYIDQQSVYRYCRYIYLFACLFVVCLMLNVSCVEFLLVRFYAIMNVKMTDVFQMATWQHQVRVYRSLDATWSIILICCPDQVFATHLWQYHTIVLTMCTGVYSSGQ